MLTDQQDVELYRDIFNFYKKYKKAGDSGDPEVWYDAQKAAEEIKAKFRSSPYADGMITLTYGEIYRNCPEAYRAQNLFDQKS